jgi:hypothetical protein
MNNSLRDIFALFRKPERTTGVHLLLIVALGVICYGNTFSVPFYFDDYDELVNDPSISGTGSLWDLVVHGGARRFADVTFAINYKIHGLNVAGYHFVNTTIHILGAVAVYFLCLSIINALNRDFSGNVPEYHGPSQAMCRFIPLATSMLFVSHPVQTQAVTYIIQRYTSLVACFYIFTMLAYVKGRVSLESQGRNGTVAGWWALAAVSALLGIFTKQSFFSAPLMILLFEQCIFRGRFVKGILTGMGAFAVVTVGILALPVFINGGTITDVMHALQRATSEDLFSSRSSFFFTQLRVIVTYLRLLIVPVQQRLDYDYPEFSTLFDFEVFASAIVHVMLISLAGVMYWRSTTRLSDRQDPYRLPQRLIVIGIAWFYIALSVTSSIFPIPDDIAEHRIYLPSVGLFLAFAAFVQLIALKYNAGLRYQKLGLSIICLALALTTISRNLVWGDELRFWQNEVRLSPENGLVHGNLGFAYLRHNNHEYALLSFAQALKLEPSIRKVWIALGPTMQGLNLYPGRFTSGEEYLTPEGDIDPRWYKLFFANAFNVMGLINELIGQPEAAIVSYNKGLVLNPDSDMTLYNLGLLSLQQGNFKVADRALLKLKGLTSPFADDLERRTILLRN